MEYNSENPSRNRQFKRYIDMDIPRLIQHIEQGYLWKDKSEMLWDLDDTLRPWIRSFIQKITKQPTVETPRPNRQYPFLDIFSTTRLREYASEVAWVVCHLEKLCENFDTFSDLPYEEQLDTISEIIATHPKLDKYRYRVSAMAMTVLITKIGIAQFCGCASK